MTHDEFMFMYDKSLRHGWATSKIASIAAKQKERERLYNRDYYRLHSDKWNRKDRITMGKYQKSDTAGQFKKLHPDPKNYYSEKQWNNQLALLEAYDKRINGTSSNMASIAEQAERTRARQVRDYGRKKAEEEKTASVSTKINSLLDVAGMTFVRNLRKSGHTKAASFVSKIVNRVAASHGEPFTPNHFSRP